MQTSAVITGEEVNSRYAVLRLNRDNIADLSAIYTAVYGTSRSDDYFIKKYDTAYTGVEHVGFIAYNQQQQPVAYYGVIPCFIEWKDQKILAAQSADTMTDPLHRFKGMFVDLSNKTFALCRELDIRLVFGFPNQHSYHGAVNKLGWKMTETLDFFAIDIKTFPWKAITRRLGLEKIYSRYCTRFLKKRAVSLKGVKSSVLAGGHAAVHRSDDYFRYKGFSDTIVIREEGAMIWMSIKNALLIGDMQDVDETNFKRVMDRMKKIAKKLGIKQIQFHGSPGTPLHQLFSGLYKPVPSFPSLFQDFGSPVPPGKN